MAAHLGLKGTMPPLVDAELSAVGCNAEINQVVKCVVVIFNGLDHCLCIVGVGLHCGCVGLHCGCVGLHCVISI